MEVTERRICEALDNMVGNDLFDAFNLAAEELGCPEIGYDELMERYRAEFKGRFCDLALEMLKTFGLEL